MSEDDLEDDLILAPTVISPPSALVFQPWHKPRKQLVRQWQWMKEASDLIAGLKKNGLLGPNRPFRYLTLPGVDLLDVRMMADLCRRNGVRLHYTGFCAYDDNEEDRLRRNISAALASQNIAEGSNVHQYKLEEIASTNSQAAFEFRRGGRYHLVNIDACSTIATEQGLRGNTTIVDALKALLEYQAGMQSPWVLLLTTVLQKDRLDARVWEAMQNAIVANCDFQAFREAFVGSGETGEPAEIAMSRYDGTRRQFVETTTLGLSKWLLHLAESCGLKVTKRPGYCYSLMRELTGAKELGNGNNGFCPRPNMLSACYKIEPIPVQAVDPNGLINTPDTQDTNNSFSHHVLAASRSAGLKDLDKITVESPELYFAMASATAELLREAGFGENTSEEYLDWIDGADAVYPFVSQAADV